MQKATNYIRGSVRLEAVGPYPERFFNICAAGASGSGGWSGGDETHGAADGGPLPGPAGPGPGPQVPVRGDQNRGGGGAPLFWGSSAAGTACWRGWRCRCWRCWCSPGLCWSLDITGNTAVPDGVILSELRESGLAPGVYGPSLDERSIANRTLMELEELSFLSVNLRGIRAEVVVRGERSGAGGGAHGGGLGPDCGEERRHFWTFTPWPGSRWWARGTRWRPGDVLVSGTVTITREDDPSQVISSYPVLARAVSWAEVEEQFSASIPLNCLQKAYTGRVRREYELVDPGAKL